ncbi:GNAT family N-acetyltransferase [Tepidamorphus sp. 3E244]|uniref:GNAT family N-acetyltransferase n=1 Tax=Tepidamorphus sp. 3E244 TaxID=3385498 RepID=UPI0038FC40E6
MTVTFRDAGSADRADLARLYRAAFPDEDLTPLLDELASLQVATSLVAEREGVIAGHVAGTFCGVEGAAGKVFLVGPLAVAPDAQRIGVGRGLVATVLEAAGKLGARKALVLGDPAYYGRLGFSRESGVMPPYPLPEEWSEAWQSKPFGAGVMDLNGKLIVPEPWARPELWA